jgi:hypothetical protein
MKYAIQLGALIIISLSAVSPLGAQAYAGTWTGTATQPGGEITTWSVAMELGASGGRIRFPSLGCGGSLAPAGGGESSPVFRELLEYGQDRCLGGLSVRLSAIGPTSLRWEEIDGGGAVLASATLTRSGPPPRSAEVAGSIQSIEAAARSPGCVGAVACNFFVGRIAELRGVPYFREVLSDRSSDGRAANEIYGFVNRAVASPASGWRRVAPGEAQALADQGKFVIGVARSVAPGSHGHIAVVPPSAQGQLPHADRGGTGPWVRDSQNPGLSVRASARFGSSVVEPIWAVWVHDLPAGPR